MTACPERPESFVSFVSSKIALVATASINFDDAQTNLLSARRLHRDLCRRRTRGSSNAAIQSAAQDSLYRKQPHLLPVRHLHPPHEDGGGVRSADGDRGR